VALSVLLPAQDPFFPFLHAGLDSAEIVSQLRAAHAAEPDASNAGVDVTIGGVGDMQQVCSGYVK
jgi:chaperonin GroEL (HSP60 family)